MYKNNYFEYTPRCTAYHHVRVSDGLDFVNIVILYYRVEARVQVVQKINHLK